MARNRISRGIAFAGYIAPNAGLHQGLEFIYKPVMPDESAELDDSYERESRISPAQATKWLSGAIAERILWWNEEGDSGGMAPITGETMLSFPPRLWTELVGIVRGRFASDRPEKGSESEKAFIEVQRRAEAYGKNGAAALAEHVTGN